MKKAQGGPAASLVTIIAVIIILYILFLPAEEREALLNITPEEAEEKAGKEIEEKTLVFEHPGLLDFLRETEREHSVPSISLFTKTEAELLKEVASAHVRNGWFAKKTYNLDFSIDDLDNTENALLSFNIKQTRGRLIIKLNGEEIFNSKASLGNIDPISLPDRLLTSANLIEFSASGVGAKFWSLNEYNLEDIKVTADITDISNRESVSVFIMSNTEKSNLDETRLRFLADCVVTEVDKLIVSINEREIYSSVPDCGLPSTINFLPDYIKAGENRLKFSTTEGRYFIDFITVKAQLKEIVHPIYYFGLDESDIRDIEAGDANVTLELQFVDGGSKRADIVINGRLTFLDTTESTYEKTIDAFLEEGNNYVQIKPRTTLNVVDLKVMLND